MYFFKGTASEPAFAGAYMLRVVQGSTSVCSIQYLLESENRYYATYSVRVLKVN